MRHHGFLAVISAVSIAGVTWLANQKSDLTAAEEPNRSFREALAGETPQAPVETEDGIRLNYFEAGWDAVLSNFAKQANLILVMDKIPHGRYARRDRRRYEPESALRILNAELEPQGFRLIKQGRHLIVLKLDQARTRYARPVLEPPAPADQAGWQSAGRTQTAASAAGSGQTTDRAPGTNPFANAGYQADRANSPQAARNPFQNAGHRRDERQQVAWRQEESVPAPAAAQQPFGSFVKPGVQTPITAEQSPAKVDEGPMITQTLPVINGKAADVARSIYLVFESRSELQREGLDGLPTFVVNDRPLSEGGETRPLFRVGIDTQNNNLQVEASRTRGQHLARLVRELDKPKTDPAETVKLVPNNGVSEDTAKDLNKQIHRMVAMQNQPGAQPPAPLQPPMGTPPAASSQSVPNTLNLRGEVNVQAVPDLGILILKGNEADVEKVTRIVQQLETMSVGSLPAIHVLTLSSVNSEAMAELMTQVYEELASVRARGGDGEKEASFIPVVKPNAILILAPEIDLPSILELAGELDRPVDPEAEFEVFSLRNAIATQVVTNIEGFYEERGGLATRVRIIADSRTNAVIVQGRPNDLSEIGRLIEKMDRDEPGSVHRVEIVQLQHATAEELSETINNAIQSAINAAPTPTTGGQGTFGGLQGQNQDLQATKSVALEFLSASEGGRELLRSGILSDVRVTPDARTNKLFISAPEASIPLLLALVEQLDRAPSAVSEIKVFALKNADAEQSVELLTSLFEDQNQEDQLGVVIAGAEDAASSLIPVVFSADLRTNTILAVGSPETLAVVDAILLRLDATESRERLTEVLPLQNVLASEVASALDDFLEQQSELQDSAEGLVSNIERLRQEVLVTADDNSNSLIVSASPEYFSQVTAIVENLDALPPQVVIQALLVEVQLDNTDEFGVELGFQDPTLFTRSLLESTADLVTTTNIVQAANGQQLQETLIQSQNRTPGFNFNNTISPLGNNASGDTSVVGTQGLSNFSLGRQNGDLGFGGFVFSAQSDAVSVLVRALAARRTVHILSRPQIRATHNLPASINVGQEVPVVNGVTVNDNFVTPNIESRSVGIILEVTPRVTSDGTVFMDVYAEKSGLASGGVPVFTDVTTGNVVESVIINSAIADTVVAVPNGQTIVIGGMITKNDETLERKVPWLGDLPIVGQAFRYDGTNTARTELLIFLTPRVVYSDIDAEVIKQIESERLHFIESEAEEIHGPIFSVPPTGIDQGPITDADFFVAPLENEIPPQIGPAIPEEPPVGAVEEDVLLPPQAGVSRRAAAQRSLARQSDSERRSADRMQILPASGTRERSPAISNAVSRQLEDERLDERADEREPAQRRSWADRLLRR